MPSIACSYCYKDGEFAGGNMDLKEFQDFCKQKIIESGSPQFAARLFMRGMGRLERLRKA